MGEEELSGEFFNKKYERPDLDEARLEVASCYLAHKEGRDLTPLIGVSEVLQKVKADGRLEKPSYEYIVPEIQPDEVPEKWGFTLEEGIADLAIVLNRLGVYTSSACEGHLDWNEPFAQVSFWNENFYALMGMLAEYGGVDDPSFKIRSTPSSEEGIRGRTFDLVFDCGGDLEGSRKKAQELADFLKSRVG